MRHGLTNPILVYTNEGTCSLSSVIAKLKLHILPMVQTTIGFGNLCYSERLRDLSLSRLELMDVAVSLCCDEGDLA